MQKFSASQLKAEALPKFPIPRSKVRISGTQTLSKMTNNVLLPADFNQHNVRNGVIEMLASNLKDNLDKDTSKSSLKESLALIQKGNKVP